MRKSLILIFVLLFILCETSLAFCKGTIMDCDSYDTYIGMTKSEVKSIAKLFEKTDDESVYTVDFLSMDADHYIQLNVAFNRKDIVCAVIVIYSEEMGSAKIDTPAVGFTTGLTFLGVNNGRNRTTIYSEPYNDIYYGYLDKLNICDSHFNEGFYTVTCYDKDESLKYFTENPEMFELTRK